MIRAGVVLLLYTLIFLATIPGLVSGHAPQFTEGNDDLSTSKHIDDPAKSWVIYTHVHHGSAKYFSFEMEAGERLLLSLIIPAEDGRRGFVPSMVLMTPGAGDNVAIPSFIEVPSGYGHTLFIGELPDEVRYEGFTPSTYYEVLSTDGPAPSSGAYYVAIYSEAIDGNAALVVGYEERFTLTEIVLIPFSLLGIYQWQGQGILVIMLPMLITLITGGVILVRRGYGRGLSLYQTLASFAALAFLGTAASTLTQMLIAIDSAGIGPEILITIFLIVVPGALGAVALLRVLEEDERRRRTRLVLLIIAVLAIFAWAGYLVGPALMIVAAIMPSNIANISVIKGSTDGESG